MELLLYLLFIISGLLITVVECSVPVLGVLIDSGLSVVDAGVKLCDIFIGVIEG